MKDSIQNTGNEVAIVVYDAPLPPKYFRIKKSFIKTILITAPLLTILLVTTLFIWGLGERLQTTPVPHLPVVISESDKKITTLEKELKELHQTNEELLVKLASTPTPLSSEDPYLMMIKKPYGMQNLIEKKRIGLDHIKFSQTNKLELSFQLVSRAPESKVSGHILVFMVSDSGVMAYPAEANKQLAQGLKYSIGESFSVSRIRPTKAEFNRLASNEPVKFVIYIFTREGDLLLIQETESFQLGAQK